MTEKERSEAEAEILKELQDVGDDCVLDDLVLDLKCFEASRLNNDGLEDQVRYILAQLGDEGLRQMRALI